MADKDRNLNADAWKNFLIVSSYKDTIARIKRAFGILDPKQEKKQSRVMASISRMFESSDEFKAFVGFATFPIHTVLEAAGIGDGPKINKQITDHLKNICVAIVFSPFLALSITALSTIPVLYAMDRVWAGGKAVYEGVQNAKRKTGEYVDATVAKIKGSFEAAKNYLTGKSRVTGTPDALPSAPAIA